ncbi:unnamed protein product [Spirodela intermedia]|uniref:Uncharacterized protein n=1 Tax=Spirodela intermedia TaxID=51605 RepID=A0A7I8J432_SPIIN|nr:unnamed protein product [Spirodela intermedia]CAA6664859.1 unnamed protein product [Spirodela intermedia]
MRFSGLRSKGPICLLVIIMCREFLPTRWCFSSTDERPNSRQYLLAWTRLLPEDNEKDQRQREKKDAISCHSKKSCSIGHLR